MMEGDQMKKAFEDTGWSKLIDEINKVKPDYGTLTIEVTFHNSTLAKASIKDKIKTVIFYKENKDE
jgi:hypothetical protein